MGAKFTPGPWEVNAYGDHREIQQVDPDGISIAIMSAGNADDARLIAAAPEMYAACKRAIRTFVGADWHCESVEILRAAVAKAEGGDS